MPQSDVRPLSGDIRASWIRLRTMILLRWFAVGGQLTAIGVAHYWYGLQLEIGLCFFVVGTSIIANLVAIFIFPENKRLNEVENMLMVLFDLLQLSVLLFLTGGLHNPFALLLLGPVTISAAVLTLRSTVLLGSTAIIIVTVLSQFYLPLRTATGSVLEFPQLFVFGNWIALIIAIVFISAYSVRVTSEIHSMSDALAATQMALAREQKLTDLGGVVAAAAHELGTPLATIKLASGELYDELSNHPELRQDAALIREQADRCRDILRDMGRAGKDDLLLHRAPLMAIVEEAAQPHMDRGKMVRFQHLNEPMSQPVILRKSEIIHGLRNLIQNAVDFAETQVWIEASWDDTDISLRIMDDGRGFPPHLIGRIGDPFVRRRRSGMQNGLRPEYEGMGLGLFIAKTLLERSGAELQFANGRDPLSGNDNQQGQLGAVVKVTWPRHRIEEDSKATTSGLGENRPISS
ncbi:Sensor histidine kinase RegB [Roseobacter fucihabitans]|uniref:histidine kinase n=1 Tax=Roseobacter fucihabitans TaxID=1537242 RepID=A0ABZ2C1Z6_9RHOB|nr:ActS/PrrB/RegB family redox-sensitive histidine kinase [Roseobacter litoralis]MBC6963892.1 Sensor histidine kinase RegB [Roseobacter litoralis]MBC6964023.1 Sensor histidine kinase RegB [Roseobacter litoralis]